MILQKNGYDDKSKIYLKFLMAGEEPLSQTDSKDVKMIYQPVDDNIYQILIEDNKNSLGIVCMDIDKFINHNIDKLAERKYSKIALKKHYDLLHKNLLSRTKGYLRKKEEKQNGNEAEEKKGIKDRIIDLFK